MDAAAGYSDILAPLNASADPTLDWEWSGSVELPSDLDPGVWVASLETLDSNGGVTRPAPTGWWSREAQALFVVLPATPRARILHKLNVATWQAYNATGDTALERRSALYSRSDWSFADIRAATGEDVRGYRVSLRRPGAGTGGQIVAESFELGVDRHDPGATPLNCFAHWDLPYLAWLESRGLDVDVCTDIDLHQTPELLDGYRLLTSAGHDEYWSGEMRDAVERFTGRGGNVAFFAGNLCYWRVDLGDIREGVPTAMVCDKSLPGSGGARYGGADGAGLWWLQRPDQATVAVSSRLAAYIYPLKQLEPRRHAMIVRSTVPWVFEGSGVALGAEVGGAQRLVGYESDGVDYVAIDPGVDADARDAEGNVVYRGQVRATLRDGAHPSTRVLTTCALEPRERELGSGAWVDVERGRCEEELADAPRRATAAYFVRGGTVFACGTTDWARVLGEGNGSIGGITENVIVALSQEARIVAIADLNGDGADDVVLSTTSSAGQALFSSWTLDAQGASGGVHISQSQIEGWTVGAAGDVDGDGRVELFFARVGVSSPVACWTLQGGETVLGGELLPLELGATERLVGARDLDGDGTPELMVCDEASATLRVYRISGAPTQRVVTLLARLDGIAPAGARCVGAADVDLDGRAEPIFEAPSGAAFAVMWASGWTVGPTRALATPLIPGALAAALDREAGPTLVFSHPSFDECPTRMIAWSLDVVDSMIVRETTAFPGTGDPDAAGRESDRFEGWSAQPSGGSALGDSLGVAPHEHAAALTTVGRGGDGLVYRFVQSPDGVLAGPTVLGALRLQEREIPAAAVRPFGGALAAVRDGASLAIADERTGWVWNPHAGVTLVAGDQVVCASDVEGRVAVLVRDAGVDRGSGTAALALAWETAPGNGIFGAWEHQPIGGVAWGEARAIAAHPLGGWVSAGRGADDRVYLGVHDALRGWARLDPIPGLRAPYGESIALASSTQWPRVIVLARDFAGRLSIASSQDSDGDRPVWAPWRTLPSLATRTGGAIAVAIDAVGRGVVAARGRDGFVYVSEEGTREWTPWARVSRFAVELDASTAGRVPALRAAHEDRIFLTRLANGRLGLGVRLGYPVTQTNAGGLAQYLGANCIAWERVS